MIALHTAHLLLLGIWAGLIMAEVAVEVLLREADEQVHAAKIHFWIDVTVEIPVVLGVLVTGSFLLAQRWPPSPILMVKVAAGLCAAGLNLFCAFVVALRYRHPHDSRRLLRYRNYVFFSGLGIPFALVAAWIGLAGYR